jgi:predicted protein tyrosine phosphatase
METTHRMVATKAFTTFIELHSLFRSDQLSTNSKLTPHKVPIRSITTYACLAWELAADTHLMMKIMKIYMFTILNKAKERHRKYKRLKLGGGQVYHRSSD